MALKKEGVYIGLGGGSSPRMGDLSPAYGYQQLWTRDAKLNEPHKTRDHRNGDSRSLSSTGYASHELWHGSPGGHPLAGADTYDSHEQISTSFSTGTPTVR